MVTDRCSGTICSGFFRDMLPLPRPVANASEQPEVEKPTIGSTLEIPTIELDKDSVVVAVFLDQVYGLLPSLDSFDGLYHLESSTIVPLRQLCSRFDCESIQENLEAVIEDLTVGRPWEALSIASLTTTTRLQTWP